MLRFIGFYDYTVILTYMSLVSAALGIMLSSKGDYSLAVLCLFISGFCDAFDGTVARTKKNRTEDEKAFGIQLDSLVDVISFGVSPAFLCYCMGVNGFFGITILCAYCICAVVRLAFFNVLEAKRQQEESGSNKYYRGLPVTSISVILPLTYLSRYLVSSSTFTVVLHILMTLVAFFFILDFKLKKPDITKLFIKK